MENKVSYDGVSINYSTIGAGQPVVLLHGYLESIKIWDSFASRLSNTHQVISIDLPGHGKSEAIDEQTIERMAESVLTVLDAEKLEKVHLVGHSMGGYVTLAFLEKFPDRLKTVCLFHSQPFADAPAAVEKRGREIELVLAGKKKLLAQSNIPNAFASDNLSNFEKEIDKAKSIALETGAEGIVACLKSMRARPDRSKLWSSCTLPSLLVVGLKDNYIPKELIDRIQMPATGQYLFLESSGHQGFIEEEELSLTSLTTFWEN